MEVLATLRNANTPSHGHTDMDEITFTHDETDLVCGMAIALCNYLESIRRNWGATQKQW